MKKDQGYVSAGPASCLAGRPRRLADFKKGIPKNMEFVEFVEGNCACLVRKSALHFL